MDKRVKYITIGLIILLAFSCKSPDYYDKEEFIELVKTPGYEVFDTIHFDNSEIYHMYQDEGALGGHQFYLFHKNNSDKYHNFLYSGYHWKNYILETCSNQGQVLKEGSWVEIKGTKTNYEYIFNPNVDSILISKTNVPTLKEGVYSVSNTDLNWHGKLTDFCSFEDLKPGLYFLTPPSLFYKTKTDIKDIENKYD